MKGVRIGAPLAACLAVLCFVPAQAQQANMTFLRDQCRSGQGRRSRRTSRRGPALSAARVSRPARTKNLARLSVDARRRRRKRARPHRQRPLDECKGVVVATSVDDLHSANNKLSKQNNLSEKGDVINGRGDTPNRHDILTGSTADGKAFPDDKDMTCKNYTSSTQGSVMLGHNDRQGLRMTMPQSHGTRRIPRAGPMAAARRPICVQHRRRWAAVLLCSELVSEASGQIKTP